MSNELYFVLKDGLDICIFTEAFDSDTNFCYVRPEYKNSKDKYLVYLHEKVDGWNIYGITNNRLYTEYNIGIINKLTLWNIDDSPMGTTVNMTVPLYYDISGAMKEIERQKLEANKTHNDATDAIRYALPWCNHLKNKKETIVFWKDGSKSVIKCEDENNDSKKETKMNLKNNIAFIKNIKFNGPATIVFWTDGSKTVVKCKDENNDPFKGFVMALAKEYTIRNTALLMKNIFIFNTGIEVVWSNGTTTELEWKDETHDIEKHLALAKIKKYGALVRGVKNTNWYSQVRAIFKQYYGDRPVAKVIDNLPEKEKTTMMQAFANSVVKAKSETSHVNELLKRAEAMTREEEFQNTEPIQDLDTDQTSKILAMFNQGFSISKIAKQTGISEYYVKRYLDTVTSPNLSDKSKKPERILRKALKSSAKKDKKERKPRPRMTSLIYPEYLEKEECDKLVELTKEKYANKPNIRYLSELQKYFIRECRRYKTMQLWGNGYSAYEIGKIIGVAASGVMKYVKSGEADKE